MQKVVINQDVGSGAAVGRCVSHQTTLGLLVRGKNINETTLLATDYLNHFNEIIMVLELVPDMPDCLEEAREWAPKSYQEHFRDSAFTDKDLAILAYENAPEAYKVPFDETVDRMNRLVEQGLQEIADKLESEDEVALRVSVEVLSRRLRDLIDGASAIIHGHKQTADQDDVDQIMGGPEETADQAEIDKLFDD